MSYALANVTVVWIVKIWLIIKKWDFFRFEWQLYHTQRAAHSIVEWLGKYGVEYTVSLLSNANPQMGRLSSPPLVKQSLIPPYCWVIHQLKDSNVGGINNCFTSSREERWPVLGVWRFRREHALEIHSKFKKSKLFALTIHDRNGNARLMDDFTSADA